MKKIWIDFVLSMTFLILSSWGMGWVFSDLSISTPWAIVFLFTGTFFAARASLSLEKLTEKGARAPFWLFFFMLSISLGAFLLFLPAKRIFFEDIQVDFVQNLALIFYLGSLFIVMTVLVIDRLVYDEPSALKKHSLQMMPMNTFLSLIVCAGVFSLFGWNTAMARQTDVRTVWGWHNARANALASYERGEKTERDLFLDLKNLDNKRQSFDHLFFADQLIPQTAFIDEGRWCLMNEKRSSFYLPYCHGEIINSKNRLTREIDYISKKFQNTQLAAIDSDLTGSKN